MRNGIKLRRWSVKTGFAALLAGSGLAGMGLAFPAEKPLRLTFEAAVSSGKIKNIFSDVNLWDFREDWLDAAKPYPDDYFASHYPFVKHIQFMTATGGDKKRDLFRNPEDRTVLNDYQFEPLVTALRNVVRQGLKPMIKTGNVPLKFTATPATAAFGVNVRPPDNFEAYYGYIKALAATLVKEFGIGEVKTWSWGVLTEYENKDWFQAADGSPESTLEAYCKLYDYTVAALESEIGAENLEVGAHSMTVMEGHWDELKFLDHVARGENYKTGRTGTQLDFLATSYYDKSPGKPLPGNLSLEQSINRLRERAEANGLKNLRFGVDEGRLLYGPEDDGRDLWSRVVGHSFQGASDARMFRIMTDLGADWFSNWGLTTDRLWGGVETVATHVAGLGYRMAGQERIGMTVTGAPRDSTNEVAGLGSRDPAAGKIYLMLYNYHAGLAQSGVEEPVVEVKDIVPEKGKTVIVKQWIVDDRHGNFWPAWWKDQQEKGLNKDAFSWSFYSVDVPRNMLHQKDRDFWYSKEAGYKELAKLAPATTTVEVRRNVLTLKPRMEPHSVIFYEISGCRIRR